MLIKSNKEGLDTNKILAEQASETFVKIMTGTNIFDMKLNSDEGKEDDLLSSDFDGNDAHHMQAALKDGKPAVHLNASSSVNLHAHNNT